MIVVRNCRCLECPPTCKLTNLSGRICGYWQETWNSRVRDKGLGLSQYSQQRELHFPILSSHPPHLLWVMERGPVDTAHAVSLQENRGPQTLATLIFYLKVSVDEYAHHCPRGRHNFYHPGQETNLPLHQWQEVFIFQGCLIYIHTWK